jgi:RHS repeat-associated protein
MQDAYGTATTSYDADSEVVNVWDDMDRMVTYGYDSLGRETTMQDADGTTTMGYDQVGNETSVTDPDNHTTAYGFDLAGRQTSVTDGNGHTTTNQYDGDGNVTSVEDAKLNITSYQYDSAGDLTQSTNALSQSVTYAYDGKHQLTSTTDAIGQRRDISYNAEGQETGEVWKNAGGTTVNTVTNSYDGDGDLTSAADASGAYTLSYNVDDRVTTIQEPFGVTLTEQYDPDGNRTLLQDSLGGTTTFSYDSDNSLTQVQFNNGTTSMHYDQHFNADGQLLYQSRYNAASGGTLIGTTTYGYDNAGRETSLQDKNGSGTNIANFTYGYDNAGLITSSQLNGGSAFTYLYDSASQLTSETNSGGVLNYTYDQAGNRNMSGYTTGTDNQLLNAGTWSYTYDNNGNEATKSQGPTYDTWYYGYDDKNRLTSVQDKTSGGTVLSQATYVYDVLSNRIEEDVYISGSGTTVTRFAYDGQNAFADLNNSNALTMRRLYLNGIDQLFARIDSGGTAAWYETDRLGSVTGLVNSSGTSIATIAYDGFGNTLAGSTTTSADRYLWAGMQLDSYTGLYMGEGPNSRGYSSANGNFARKDDIGFSGGLPNLYDYTGNDPTNRVDPTGTDAVELDRFAGMVSSGDPTGWVTWKFKDGTSFNIGKSPNPNSIAPSPTVNLTSEFAPPFNYGKLNLSWLQRGVQTEGTSFSDLPQEYRRPAVKFFLKTFLDQGNQPEIENGRFYGYWGNNTASGALRDEFPDLLTKMGTSVATELATTFLVPPALNAVFGAFVKYGAKYCLPAVKDAFGLVKGRLFKKLANNTLATASEKEAAALANAFNKEFKGANIRLGGLSNGTMNPKGGPGLLKRPNGIPSHLLHEMQTQPSMRRVYVN